MPKAKKIDPEKFYSTAEICGDMDVLTAKSANTKRQMLLRHIREGRIAAINVDSAKKPRYVVQGKNLISYRNSNMGVGSYETK